MRLLFGDHRRDGAVLSSAKLVGAEVTSPVCQEGLDEGVWAQKAAHLVDAGSSNRVEVGHASWSSNVWSIRSKRLRMKPLLSSCGRT